MNKIGRVLLRLELSQCRKKKDYSRLVDHKPRTAGELYELMVDRFDRGRAFVLELLVVIILVIEIIFLFRGKG